MRVGPQSAGADPGPASYGTGGTEPTVTDANVVLGYLPAELAGGEIQLDVEAARKAVETISAATGLGSVEAAAAGIYDIVNENMYGALKLVSTQQGFDPRDFALIAFGGAGPLHANALGRLTGAWPVIVPPSPGVLCAYGDATTSLRDEAVRTLIRRFDDVAADELGEILDELGRGAQQSLLAAGVAADDVSLTFAADLRYHGQGFEIPIVIDRATLDSAGLDGLRAAFDAEHERLFNFLLRNEQELVTVRATASGPRPTMAPVVLEEGSPDPSDAAMRPHRLWVEGAEVDATIYDRNLLRAGNVITGPAVVVEMDSTTLILPGHAATVHSSGALLIRPLETSVTGKD